MIYKLTPDYSNQFLLPLDVRELHSAVLLFVCGSVDGQVTVVQTSQPSLRGFINRSLYLNDCRVLVY